MVLTYDNHLEVHLLPTKKNPPPPPPDNAVVTVVTISIGITITIALELAGVINIGEVAVALPMAEQRSQDQISPFEGDSIERRITKPNPPVGGPLLPNPGVTYSNYRVRIDRCHDMRYEGANFRAYPAMTPHAIKGAVLTGEWVVLTGVTAYGDGILWYEVMNESPLTHSLEAYTYVSAPNQYGWIASCFIK